MTKVLTSRRTLHICLSVARLVTAGAHREHQIQIRRKKEGQSTQRVHSLFPRQNPRMCFTLQSYTCCGRTPHRHTLVRLPLLWIPTVATNRGPHPRKVMSLLVIALPSRINTTASFQWMIIANALHIMQRTQE